MLKQSFPDHALAINPQEMISFSKDMDKEWLKYSNIISVISSDDFFGGKFHDYTSYGLISESPYSTSNAFYSVIPENRYLIADIRVKTYEHVEIDRLYPKLLQVIEENNLTVTGDIMERNILDLYNDHGKGDIHYIKIYVPL